MKTIKNILVGLDFSKSSKAAFREADRIAMTEKGELHALHVIAFSEAEEIIELSSSNKEVFSPARNALKEECEKTSCKADHIEYHIAVGHPFYQLMNWVDAVDADLLVLGSHGQGTKDGNVGVVAMKCIQHAQIPVLLVRKRQESPFQSIVACTDFSDTAREAVYYSAEIASKEGAKLYILHVQEDPWSIYSFPVAHSDKSKVREYLNKARDKAEENLEDMKRVLAKKYPNLDVSTVVFPPTTTVTQGICSFVNEKEVDLAIIGARGHSKVYDFFLGTTTERIIRRCACSVLTVK